MPQSRRTSSVESGGMGDAIVPHLRTPKASGRGLTQRPPGHATIAHRGATAPRERPLNLRPARALRQFSVAGALQTVLFEEWAHHLYATRDLARLEASSP